MAYWTTLIFFNNVSDFSWEVGDGASTAKLSKILLDKILPDQQHLHFPHYFPQREGRITHVSRNRECKQGNGKEKQPSL